MNTYLLALPNAVVAEEVGTILFSAPNQIVDALCSSAAVTIVKTKVTGFFPVLPLRAIPNLYIKWITQTIITYTEGALPFLLKDL